MHTSKGVDSEKMWREVGRSLDDVGKVSKRLNEKLSFHEVGGSRNVNIKFEILWWWMLLQYTGYLLEHQGKNLAYNMYCEPLNADVINISENAKEKMLSYFKIMQEEGSVARGRISSLQVLPTEELDELLFEFEVDEHDEIILEWTKITKA